MTTMTSTACPTGQWTQIVTPGPTSVTVQNIGGVALKLRIGDAVTTSDDLGSDHDILQQGEYRQLTLEASDAVLAAPLSDQFGGGRINVRA